MAHRNPITHLPTHSVTNQPPPLEDYNAFGEDAALKECFEREGASWTESMLRDLGAHVGSAHVIQLGCLANDNIPQLKTHDRFGRRIDEVDYHPAYHQLLNLAIENQVHSIAWTSDQTGGHVVHAASIYMLTQAEAGVCCPLAMTYAAIPSLRHQPELAAEWEPRLLSNQYDPRSIPAAEKKGATIGMAMTEKQGGSDVRANTTKADLIETRGPGQAYRLNGHKWFCSAPMSDAFLTLAHTKHGLSCFLVPRWLPDGSRNRFFIQRLKNKLGNRSNASSVIEYSDTCDILVNDERCYSRSLAQDSLGLGESYVDGWWDCEQTDEFIHRVLRSGLHCKFGKWLELPTIIKAKLINLQSASRAAQVGKQHYDIGNDLYRRMLDKRMIYSCAYWRNAATLDDAQHGKLDLVCRKLDLQPGMKVLDVGCGWGGAALFAAENYGVEVVGVTISRQQAELAQDICRGLPIEIELKDYRATKGTFDRIYSLGMFEHVGCRNYSNYMRFVADRLTEDGLFLLQSIGSNYSDTIGNPWTERYIFPNSMLPSAKQITTALEGRLVLEDWHSFGCDYDKTLMQWFRNFNHNWDALSQNYDERFFRMWKYYLLSFAGSFRARYNQLWQIVASRKGIEGGYLAPR